jgi:predicted sulfurtransferase
MFRYIIYVSSLNRNLDIEDLKEFSTSFQCENKKRDVTGVLVFSQGVVMQYIEGSEKDIDTLYKNIAKDVRHSSVIKIGEGYVKNKIFKLWDMRVKKVEINKLLELRKSISEENRDILVLFRSFIDINIR